MIDVFCKEKEIKQDFVKEIMRQIDSDNSNTITAKEFFESVVDNLNMQRREIGVDLTEIVRVLKYEKGLKCINCSSTFIGINFDALEVKSNITPFDGIDYLK